MGGYYGPVTTSYYPNSGEVKLDTKVKDAEVFINGAYAGTTKRRTRQCTCAPAITTSRFAQAAKPNSRRRSTW